MRIFTLIEPEQIKYCIECDKKLNSHNELGYCRKHRHLSPLLKAVKKKYQQSDKGRSAKKRYQQSDRGKEVSKKAVAKYIKSPKGKESRRKALRNYHLKKKIQKLLTNQ